MYAGYSAGQSFDPLCRIAASCLYPVCIKGKAHFIRRKFLRQHFKNGFSAVFRKFAVVIMIHEVFSVFLKSVDNRTERIGKIGNPMPFFMFIKSKPAQTNVFTAENIMF